MDTINLTHVPLAEVQPGSLLLIGATDTDLEQYFAIAVDGAAGARPRTRWVSFRADRGALRAVRTELVARTEARPTGAESGADTLPSSPIYTSKSGPMFVTCPCSSQVTCWHTAHDSCWSSPQPQTHGRRSLTWAAEKSDELSVVSVAVITHWNIYVRSADGHRLCLVDTKSHKQASAH